MIAPRWLRALFGWHDVRCSGVWLYQENAVTGARRARRVLTGLHQPIDFDWLDAGAGHPQIDGCPAWRTPQGQQRTAYFL